MKTMRMLSALLAVCGMLGPAVLAQEKPRPAEEAKPVTPLKVQVVFGEFEGEKKISSLPYTLIVNADERMDRPQTSVRLGLRVPILVQGKDQFQYIDVGTNIDCHARAAEEGRYKLSLSVERSSIYAAGQGKRSPEENPNEVSLSVQPIISQFKVSSNLLLRDGQTVQSAQATDPVSGRVLKIDVTLNVMK